MTPVAEPKPTPAPLEGKNAAQSDATVAKPADEQPAEVKKKKKKKKKVC